MLFKVYNFYVIKVRYSTYVKKDIDLMNVEVGTPIVCKALRLAYKLATEFLNCIVSIMFI